MIPSIVNRAFLLGFHRYASLIFALPLLVLIATGLVLSFEPVAQSLAIRPGSLTAQRLEALVLAADPGANARGLTVRPSEDALILLGARGPSAVRLSDGSQISATEGTATSVFGSARRMHERLLFDLGWLVTLSTIAMLVIAALGIAMGLPRIRNTLAGWHKATAWGLLPLIVASPLTGLALAFGLTFGAPSPREPMPSLAAAVRSLGSLPDLSGLSSIRVRGGRMIARVYENGELRSYAIGTAGIQPVPRNWPRLIHEGNWAGVWSGGLNVLTSLAMLLLLVSGVTIWARRSLRRSRSRRPWPAASVASP